MNRNLIIVLAGILCVLIVSAVAHAGPVFVATAKNFRGALYLGMGPTPYHASEMAIVKCTQNTFFKGSCRVCSVRMECPPPPPKMYKPKVYRSYPPYKSSSSVNPPYKSSSKSYSKYKSSSGAYSGNKSGSKKYSYSSKKYSDSRPKSGSDKETSSRQSYSWGRSSQ